MSRHAILGKDEPLSMLKTVDPRSRFVNCITFFVKHDFYYREKDNSLTGIVVTSREIRACYVFVLKALPVSTCVHARAIS